MARLDIWSDNNCARWRAMLNTYSDVIAAQESEKLVKLDSWYHAALPQALHEREEPFITLDELQGVTAWKMSRGVWRERNRVLLNSNSPDKVMEAGRNAFAAAPDPRSPIKILSELAGVGAATASAAMAAYMPSVYPFFDELVAIQVPGLGNVTFTLKYYLAYADALRERARELSEQCGEKWTPQDVAQALWAASGGKISHPELK